VIHEISEQPHVYLPDDLLEEILEETSSVSSSISEIFEQITRQRQQMREQLLTGGRIGRAADLVEPTQSPTVAAIDGGLAIERSLGADTVLVVAVGVEGLIPEERRRWSGVQYTHWQRVIVHEGGETSRRFALGVMAALELEILAAAPHDVIILDGSHLTPVIGLNSMLSLSDNALSNLASQLLVEHQTVEYLGVAMRRPSIVAMVKYDASRDLTQTWLSAFECAYDDRTMMTMLLEADEFTEPVQVGQTPRSRESWEKLHITVASPNFSNKPEVEQRFEDELEHVQQRNIFFTYYKPHEWAPAYRIELKRDAAESPAHLAGVLCAVKDQVLSPEIREPYPQYLADIMAKSVGDGMSALRTAVFHELGDSDASEYMRLIAQSYRTEV
jgi:hypothetical protein